MTNTLNVIRSFTSTKKFYDDINYPRGLSRSGDYSLKEVNIIENYGIALRELSSGVRQPITKEEQDFVKVCSGELQATSDIEKAWRKYQKNILSPKQFHTLFSSTKLPIEQESHDHQLNDIEETQIIDN